MIYRYLGENWQFITYCIGCYVFIVKSCLLRRMYAVVLYCVYKQNNSICICIRRWHNALKYIFFINCVSRLHTPSSYNARTRRLVIGRNEKQRWDLLYYYTRVRSPNTTQREKFKIKKNPADKMNMKI